jgi:hypothetical protein
MRVIRATLSPGKPCHPERSEGPLQFAGGVAKHRIEVLAATCRDPSAREERGHQDDKLE